MTNADADLPSDLQAAIRARDEAFYAVDPEQWGKYTAATFTTVQQNGVLMTRTERLANLSTQSKRPSVARTQEHYEMRGDLVVARFFSGGLWVVEVWIRGPENWMTILSQATTANTQT